MAIFIELRKPVFVIFTGNYENLRKIHENFNENYENSINLRLSKNDAFAKKVRKLYEMACENYENTKTYIRYFRNFY